MCAACGMTDVDPLPRWVILPNDPPPLARWLRARQAEDTTDTDDEPRGTAA